MLATRRGAPPRGGSCRGPGRRRHMPDRSRPWRTTSFRRRASSASSSASSSSRETFASLLSSERHLWREDGRGRMVGTVLERGRAGDHGASPFGVEVELVQPRLGRPRPRMEHDGYHVYYVLAGGGRLAHLVLGDGSAREADATSLRSGDIFAVAPRTPHALETSEAGGMVLLSISVPVDLGRWGGRGANRLVRGAAGGSMAAGGGEEVDTAPEQITLKGQDTPGCLLSSRLRRTAELLTFRLPNNDNRIAPIFDPFRDCTPFTCSIEILEPLGRIPKHVHDESYELFVVLSGSADLFLNDSGDPTTAAEGDTMLVRPGNFHSIANSSRSERLFMLSIILPNEQFARQVWEGTYSGKLEKTDVSHLVE